MDAGAESVISSIAESIYTRQLSNKTHQWSLTLLPLRLASGTSASSRTVVDAIRCSRAESAAAQLYATSNVSYLEVEDAVPYNLFQPLDGQSVFLHLNGKSHTQDF